MITSLAISQIFVLDQDEALDFYVGKLGLEVNTDADLGFMRWLTVNVPGDPGRQILLEKPGPPSHDDATAEQVRELLTKGAMGAAAIFTVDDIHKTYEEALADGVRQALADREPRVAAGLERAKAFTWEETARRTVTAYLEVIAA